MIFAVEDRESTTYYDAETPAQALGFHLELTPDASFETVTVRGLGESPAVPDLPTASLPRRCSLDRLVSVLNVVHGLTPRTEEVP